MDRAIEIMAEGKAVILIPDNPACADHVGIPDLFWCKLLRYGHFRVF